MVLERVKESKNHTKLKMYTRTIFKKDTDIAILCKEKT